MTMLHVRAQVSFHGDYAIVSELQSKVTILDKNNVPVAYRRQPAAEPVANYQLSPDNISTSVFSAAHGCYIDREANIYVSDWNHIGRITKLTRVAV